MQSDNSSTLLIKKYVNTCNEYAMIWSKEKDIIIVIAQDPFANVRFH